MSTVPGDDREMALHHAELYGWRWFIALGWAFLLLGTAAIAHIRIAAMVSTVVIGGIVMLGGLLGLALASRVRDSETHVFWIAGAIFYLVAGLAALGGAFIDDRLLGLLIAASLSMAGLVRLVAGAHLQCTPVLASGAATIVLAAAIGVGWPDNLLWVLGYTIASDFAAQGAALMIAGQQLHRSLGLPRR